MMISLIYFYYLYKNTIYEDNDSQSLNNTHITLLFHASKIAHIINN